MYHIIVAPSAKRELREISKLYKEAVTEAIKELKEDPFLGKPLDREFTGRFSYKIGVFRIIYKVNKENKTVFIFTAGHRSKIYD